MTVYYLDTSALVKRYVQEQGTVWIQLITDPAHGDEIYTGLLTGPELVAALFRKARIQAVSQSDVLRANYVFRVDWQTEYQIIPMSPQVADDAMELAARYGLRGFDAVHLAAAMTLQSYRRTEGLSGLIFVSADKAQLQAAVSEGLIVEDPNNHP